MRTSLAGVRGQRRPPRDRPRRRLHDRDEAPRVQAGRPVDPCGAGSL